MLVPVTDDVRLALEDRGDGPPVVLVHGWSLGQEVWRHVGDRLVEAGHRVVALDLRGHGESDPAPDGDYRLETLAGDVARVLEALDLRDVSLVGWSLGGLVSTRLVASTPERVARLVLVGSNAVAHARRPGFPHGIPTEAVLPKLKAFEEADRTALRRTVLRDGFAAPPADEVLDRLLDLSLRTQTPAALACLDTLLTTDQADVLPSIALPVTQILGEKDPSVPLSGAAWLMEQLDDARQVVLPCGHYPMLEEPEAFVDALLDAVSGSTEPVAA